MNELQQITPDTPSSVLALFSTSKQGIIAFASRVINEVESGNIDPLKAKLWCKTLQEIADKIDKGTKEYQVKEAAKYGDKPFEFAGAELHLTSTYTEYDYSTCGDMIYNELVKHQKSYNQLVKEREKFLQQLKQSMTIVDESTGETFTINPPVKKQTEGVKVSIK